MSGASLVQVDGRVFIAIQSFGEEIHLEFIMIVILVTSLFYEVLIFSETFIKRTPSGNAVVSA